MTAAAAHLLEYAAHLVNLDWKACRNSLGAAEEGWSGAMPAALLLALRAPVRASRDTRKLITAGARIAVVAHLCGRELRAGRLVGMVAYLNPLIENGLRVAIALAEEARVKDALLDLDFGLTSKDLPDFGAVVGAMKARVPQRSLPQRLWTETTGALGAALLRTWAKWKADTQRYHYMFPALREWASFEAFIDVGNRGRHTVAGTTWRAINDAAARDLNLPVGAASSEIAEALLARTRTLLDCAFQDTAHGLASSPLDLIDQHVLEALLPQSA
jgi:hypothetical protein